MRKSDKLIKQLAKLASKQARNRTLIRLDQKIQQALKQEQK